MRQINLTHLQLQKKLITLTKTIKVCIFGKRISMIFCVIAQKHQHLVCDVIMVDLKCMTFYVQEYSQYT